ncbi:HD domain-containing protein [Sediminibacillus dalangtanensis]|uniref:HD domain-containing protein n=1 Tax=Sediminibacillus dalangtanensis TaxID=2729421 RepID=A0ABX7VUB9_9BACI|nr:HD domain-containing phosphohydrolase [Sediminibacillus dalangtanensis]QTM99200.1 HD domain-containing protein [Sediminibacillus dalangtanensis]
MSYNKLAVKLMLNYLIGSLFAVFGFCSIFILHPLQASKTETIVFLGIVVVSFIVMLVLEYSAYSKHIAPIKKVLKHRRPTLMRLEAAYQCAHRFPMLSFQRIILPHFIGITAPAAILTILAINTGWLSFPYYYAFIACIAALLIAFMHGMIEYYLTSLVMRRVLTFLKEKGTELFQKDISHGADLLLSINKKFYFSAALLSVFPMLLFAAATTLRLHESGSAFMMEYIVWAVIVVIIVLTFALFGSNLLSHDIQEPVEQLQNGMRKVEAGDLAKLNNYYSDEFSHLINGFNHMVDSILEKKQMTEQLHDSFFTVFAATLDARDPYTAGHSIRVAEYAQHIGRRYGLSEGELALLKQSALLHDIGKIGIRDEILLKDGKLTESEYETIKLHTIIGEQILLEIKPSEAISPLLPGVRHHHERFDGHGYPDRLAGESIPLFGRILAVADAFDAMTSDRNYRKGMSFKKAIAILEEGKGSQWDPRFVDVFVAWYLSENRKQASIKAANE